MTSHELINAESAIASDTLEAFKALGEAIDNACRKYAHNGQDYHCLRGLVNQSLEPRLSDVILRNYKNRKVPAFEGVTP